VEVVDELPAEVFRVLVREGRPMSFQAAPEKPEGEDGEILVQPGDEDGQGGTTARHTDLRLQTTLASAQLQSRLLKIERDARTFVEEQGVNTFILSGVFLGGIAIALYLRTRNPDQYARLGRVIFEDATERPEDDVDADGRGDVTERRGDVPRSEG
jgi:hypothetical protein